MRDDDVQQQSGPRFVSRPRAELDPDQQALFDLIASGPRASQQGASRFLGERGELLGPFGPMTIAPAVGEAVQSVGAALRYRTELTALVREAAILLVAVERDSGFEWVAHATLAAQAGLDDEQLSALRAGRVPAGLDAAATLALETVRALLATGRLDDADYARAHEVLGQRQVAELVWLVGNYSMLALALSVYDPQQALSSSATTPTSTQEGE